MSIFIRDSSQESSLKAVCYKVIGIFFINFDETHTMQHW